MAERLLRLRDESGRQHVVKLGPDHAVTVGDLTLHVRTAPDGSIHVSGAEHALVWSVAIDDTRWVFVDGQVFTFDVDRPSRRRRSRMAHHATLTAPMPATVRKLQVVPGDAVCKGDVLIVLEAMKMELPIRAPDDGRVKRVNCRKGDRVQPGLSLIELDENQ